MLKRVHVVTISHTFSGPRDVEIQAESGTRTDMKHVSFISRRIEGAVHVDMYRDVQDIGVVVEGLLTAVAVVNIPIHNQDLPALFAKLCLTDSRSNADVVKQAETHGAMDLGMVPWWSDNGYRILDLALDDRATGFYRATSRKLAREEGELIEVDRVHVSILRKIYKLLGCQSCLRRQFGKEQRRQIWVDVQAVLSTNRQ